MGLGAGYAVGLVMVFLTGLFFNPMIVLAFVLSPIIGVDAVSIAEWLMVGFASLIGLLGGIYLGWMIGYTIAAEK